MLCPECSKELKPNAKRCTCGWKAVTREVVVMDKFHGWCEWIGDGQRCHYPGVFSNSTIGGGPWFCTPHSTCADGRLGAQIVEQSIKDIPKPDYSYEARRRGFIATKKPALKIVDAPTEVPF